jgi:hypothetical protein
MNYGSYHYQTPLFPSPLPLSTTAGMIMKLCGYYYGHRQMQSSKLDNIQTTI